MHFLLHSSAIYVQNNNLCKFWNNVFPSSVFVAKFADRRLNLKQIYWMLFGTSLGNPFLLNVIWDHSGESISTEFYLGPFWRIHFYWMLFGTILGKPFRRTKIWTILGKPSLKRRYLGPFWGNHLKNQNIDHSGETIFKKNNIWDHSRETISKNQNMDHSGETIFKNQYLGPFRGPIFSHSIIPKHQL